MTNTETKTERLVVRRMLPAPRARVYQAWTDPNEMKKWSGPEGTNVPEFDCDFRVGGAYRLVMVQESGEKFVAKGIYREIKPPERLSYTWTWEEDTPAEEHETLVTVEFNDRGNETELVLTHEGLISEESRDNHAKGWTSMLEKFAAFLAS